MPMKWAPRAPIKKERGEGAIQAIQTLRRRICEVDVENYKQWQGADRNTAAWQQSRTYRGLSAQVLPDMRTMVRLFDNPSRDQDYFIYRVNSEPVAVMELSGTESEGEGETDDYVKIDGLLAHPLVSGAAGAMVEVAVNSKEWVDRKPQVKLDPLHSAIGAYQAIGFESTVDGMTLNLTIAHDKWKCVDGEWRYTPSGGDAGFLTGFKAPPRAGAPVPPPRKF